MRIIFNLLDCGLNNNGGSDTIVRSANTLIGLGHEVYFVDNIKGHYDWQPIKAQRINPACPSDLPTADAVVHTGFKTVLRSDFFVSRCGKQFHWIRGWETWTYPQDYIVKHILSKPTIKLVNSSQLKIKLADHDHDSIVVMPGNDLDIYKPTGNRGNGNIVLGAQYSEGEKRKHKRVDWVFKSVSALRFIYDDVNIKLYMYGNEGWPQNEAIDKYLFCPTDQQKNQLYNEIDIWLAPTELEGLHRPPMEAMLTECPVVGTFADMSGMVDYLIDGFTGIISVESIRCFTNTIGRLIEGKEDRIGTGKAARKKIISLGSREDNMKKLVEVLQSC